MKTIDFRFFASMHDKLKGPFQPTDYDIDQLNLLYNSPNMLANRTFCSEEFASGANAYFKAHKSELTKVVAFQSSPYYDHIESMIKKIVETYPDFDAAMKYVETLKVIKDGEEWVEFKTNKGSHYKSFECFVVDLKEAFMAEYISADIVELKDYYESWLSDKNDYQEKLIHQMIDFLSTLTTSALAIEKVISDLGQKESAQNLGEEIGNRLWLTVRSINDITTSFSTPQKLFFEQLMKYKGIDGLRLLFQTFGSTSKIAEFFTPSKDLNIDNETKAESLFTELSNYLKDVDYSDIDLEYLISQGFNIKTFKDLAKQYGMPHDVIKTLTEEGLREINLTEDNVSDIFGNNKNFKLAPISYTKKNGQQGIKNYKVELLPKTDPTALFAGKMTNCCQFYTGDSSDQAVMPVYKDPNAGLIVLKEGNKVKGVSFIWLTEDKGLVLDSFEHMPEASKAFIPFITALSSALPSEYKLYMGSGGNTPKLSIQQENGELTEAIKIERPMPLSAEYKPYGDSSLVYHIEPNKNYVAKSTQIEGDPIELVLASLSHEEKEAIKDIYKKFDQYSIQEIAEHCIERGYNFTQTLTNIRHFTGAFHAHGKYAQIIDTIEALDQDKIDLINQSPEFIKKLTQSCLDYYSLNQKNQEMLVDALNAFVTTEDLETISSIGDYSTICLPDIKNIINVNRNIPKQADRILCHLMKNSIEDKISLLESISEEDKAKILSVAKKAKETTINGYNYGIQFYTEEDIHHLLQNLNNLNPEQVEKILSTQFLMTKDPALLSYALANIRDEHLLKLDDVYVYSEKEIINLANDLNKDNITQIEIEPNIISYDNHIDESAIDTMGAGAIEPDTF